MPMLALAVCSSIRVCVHIIDALLKGVQRIVVRTMATDIAIILLGGFEQLLLLFFFFFWLLYVLLNKATYKYRATGWKEWKVMPCVTKIKIFQFLHIHNMCHYE